jgi:PAS domain S-box-containing protein
MLSAIPIGKRSRATADLVGVRKRIILVAAATIGLSLLIAAATLLWHGYEERHAIAHRGLSAAAAATTAVERQVDAMGYLLKGLSRSPLLRSGDLEGFYHQLQSTPRPEGAWFILWDLDRQVMSTARPFGSALPRIDDLPGVRQRLGVVRSAGLSMSDRIHMRFEQRWVVAVSLRLDDPKGRMDRVLTLLAPEEHLNAAIAEVSGSTEWTTILLDRKLEGLSGGMGAGLTVPVAEIRRMVSGADRVGHFETGHGPGAALVAFQRSPKTGYTALSVLPAAAAHAPLVTAFYRTSLASVILILIGAGSVLVMLQNIGPVEALKLSAASTRSELLAANTRLNAILESVSDCYFTLDRSYHITDANSATLRWSGMARAEVIGRSYPDLVGHHTTCVRAVKQVIEHGGAFRGELPSSLRPDRYIEFRAYPSPEGASIFFSDVTERHAAHLALIRERELLQASLDALSAHVAILDGRGRIIAVNQAWRRFAEEIGHPDPAHGVGAGYLDIGPTGKSNLTEMEAVIDGRRPTFQALYRWSDAEPQRWFIVRASRFRAGGEAYVIVSHEDVTEVMAARASINELSDRLLTLQEEEHQRIAAELHDSTTQYLVAVGLNLMKVERLLPQHDGQLLLGEIDRLLEEALKELRLFTYLLHPASLDENGFCNTVRAFAGGFTDRTGLQVTCRIDEGADDLRIDLRRALLRIVQEALSNVHRHAAASRVVVDLRQTPDAIILCITDDGQGMQARQAGPTADKVSLGVGIPGMRIRLHQFGGSLRIRSGRRGTVVRARVPRCDTAGPAGLVPTGSGAPIPIRSGQEACRLGNSPVRS